MKNIKYTFVLLCSLLMTACLGSGGLNQNHPPLTASTPTSEAELYGAWASVPGEGEKELDYLLITILFPDNIGLDVNEIKVLNQGIEYEDSQKYRWSLNTENGTFTQKIFEHAYNEIGKPEIVEATDKTETADIKLLKKYGEIAAIQFSFGSEKTIYYRMDDDILKTLVKDPKIYSSIINKRKL